LAPGILHRVEYRYEIAAFLGRAIEQTIGVDGGIALVGGNLVMQIGFGRIPVPQGYNDIARLAFRALRLGEGQFAGGDAIGPIAEQSEGARRIQPADRTDHIIGGLPDLDAIFPGGRRGIKMAEGLGYGPRRGIAQLMAGVAAVRLDDVKPLLLALHLRGHAVAVRLCPGAGKFVRRRDVQHRVPVDGRIILRRGRFAGGGHRL